MTLAATLEVLITGDARPLQASLASASASTAKFASSTSAAGRGATAGLSAVKLGAASAGVAVGLFAFNAIKAANEYDRAFARIDAITNTTADRIGTMREEVLALSGQTAQAPVELANSFYFLASAGLSVEQQNEALTASAQASMVGLGDASDVAKIAAQALNAYADQGLTATSVTDAMVAAVREGTAEPEQFADALGRVLPVAAKAGIEFEQVTASLATMSNAGLDVHEGVTAIRAVMQSLLAPTNQTNEALAAIGLTADDVRRSLAGDGLIATLRLLDDRANGNIDVLRELIPNIRGMVGAFNLTGQEAEEVDRIFDEVANSAGSLSDAVGATEQSNAFKFAQAWQQIKNVFQDLASGALPFLAGALSAIAAVAAPLVPIIVALGFAFGGLALVRVLTLPITRFSNSLLILADRIAQAGVYFTGTRDSMGAFAMAAGTTRTRLVSLLGSIAKVGGPILAIGLAFKLATNLMSAFEKKIGELAEANGVGADTLIRFSEALRSVEGADLIDKFGGTSEELADFAPVLGEISSGLQEVGLSAESADKFLASTADLLTDTTPAGIAQFKGQLEGTIDVIRGFGTALADGSMPMDTFLLQMETLGFEDLDQMALARAALDSYGKTLQDNGRITTNFLNMTKDELKEWNTTVTGEFAEAIHSVDDFGEVFDESAKKVLRGVQNMARVAEREGTNLLKLVKMDVPDEFINFLIERGPNAIDKFVRGNDKYQRQFQRAWRESEGGIDDVAHALDILVRRKIDLNTGPAERAVKNLRALLLDLVNHQWTVTVNGSAGIPPAANPLSGNTRPVGGGGGRDRKRDAAYLDRERFERDHAYSREYEGWR